MGVNNSDGHRHKRPAALVKWAQRLAPLLSLVIFATALLLLHHLLRRIHLSDVARQVGQTPPRSLWSALFLTGASYLALAGFDGLGAHYIGRRLSAGRILLISFVSHAVSHTAGFATLTGGAIRYRLYSAVGLSAAEVAGVVAFCSLTFGLGACSLAALALLAEPTLLSSVLRFPAGLLRALGAFLAVAVGGYVLWGALSPRPLSIFGRSYAVPRPHTAGLQIAVAASDLALAAAALFVLLPEALRPSYPAFLGAYVVANLLGLLAHVPGGLGVFDAAILVLTPGAPPDVVLGALLLFRCLYQLLPLSLAALLLLGYELLERLPNVGHRLGRPFDELGPPLLAMLVFATGAVTLFVQAAPAAMVSAGRTAMAMAEAAIGAILMVLARGLNRRDRRARLAAVACMALLAAVGLARDPFAPRPVVWALLGVILALSGPLSGPVAGLLPPPLSAPWVMAIGVVVAGACSLTWWDGRTQLASAPALHAALLADGGAVAIFVLLVSLGHRR